MIPSPEPWQLLIPFSALVASSIGEAIDSFGFTMSELQPNLVQFENERVVLYVMYQPHDGEVSIAFGRTGTEERYSFLLYLRSRAPEDEAAIHSGICWTTEEVRAHLSRLARALVEHGAPVLEGDAQTYSWMDGVRWWGSPTDPPP